MDCNAKFGSHKSIGISVDVGRKFVLQTGGSRPGAEMLKLIGSEVSPLSSSVHIHPNLVTAI